MRDKPETVIVYVAAAMFVAGVVVYVVAAWALCG
jgi:uncharacterized membrane protein YiaA